MLNLFVFQQFKSNDSDFYFVFKDKSIRKKFPKVIFIPKINAFLGSFLAIFIIN